MNHWCRLWGGMPNDPKWRLIARRAGASIAEVGWVFVHLMDNASAAQLDGELKGWNDEVVAVAADRETAKVASIREAMQGLVLDGISLTGWAARQPRRDDHSTDRVRRFRERRAVETEAEKAALPATPPETKPEDEKPPEKPKKPPRQSRVRTSLAEDAQPNEAQRETAERHSMPRNVFRTEWQRFRAHHVGKGTLAASWEQTWVTWVLNWKQGYGQPARGPAAPREQPDDPFIKAVRKKLERLENANPRQGAALASTLPDSAFTVADPPFVALPPGTVGPESVLDFEPIRTERRRESDLD